MQFPLLFLDLEGRVVFASCIIITIGLIPLLFAICPCSFSLSQPSSLTLRHNSIGRRRRTKEKRKEGKERAQGKDLHLTSFLAPYVDEKHSATFGNYVDTDECRPNTLYRPISTCLIGPSHQCVSQSLSKKGRQARTFIFQNLAPAMP